MSITVSADPVLEAIARKLSGFGCVPVNEQQKMIAAAAKAGMEAAKEEALMIRKGPTAETIVKQAEKDDNMLDMTKTAIKALLEEIDENDALKKENEKLKEDIETFINPNPYTGLNTLRLVTVEQLKEIEWAWHHCTETDEEWQQCPVCGGYPDMGGHGPSCWLGNTLKGD